VKGTTRVTVSLENKENSEERIETQGKMFPRKKIEQIDFLMYLTTLRKCYSSLKNEKRNY